MLLDLGAACRSVDESLVVELATLRGVDVRDALLSEARLGALSSTNTVTTETPASPTSGAQSIDAVPSPLSVKTQKSGRPSCWNSRISPGLASLAESAMLAVSFSNSITSSIAASTGGSFGGAKDGVWL